MKLVVSLDEIAEDMRHQVGGKALSLSRLRSAGIPVPNGICVLADAYDGHVRETGLRERILLELNRKPFEEMRWEELWDTGHRIRHLFLNADLRSAVWRELRCALSGHVADVPLAVRSSSPAEDSSRAAFAGVHESFLFVRGIDEVLAKIALVWASLWSDAALMYRRELGLDAESSTMAVLIQDMVNGDRSGVCFGESPANPSEAVVEAVHGLNQGLVDGTVEPDRWILDRVTGAIKSHVGVRRGEAARAGDRGVRLQPLPASMQRRVPLADEEVGRVFELARHAETLFGSPQDVEFTFSAKHLYAVQSRPVTARAGRDNGDKRPWYLSLRSSFSNLQRLQRVIEEDVLPGMREAADKSLAIGMDSLSDQELAAEVERRKQSESHWKDIYWRDLIPFAHGIRLFGILYEERVRPDDPYEFLQLLRPEDTLALRRDRLIARLGESIHADSNLEGTLGAGHLDAAPEHIRRQLDDLLEGVGGVYWGASDKREATKAILHVATQMPQVSQSHELASRVDRAPLEARYLASFVKEEEGFAREALELARASYRLRDEDNMYLGRIEATVLSAVNEGKRRISEQSGESAAALSADQVVAVLRGTPIPAETPAQPQSVEPERPLEVRFRQLVGQPAGPGLASGAARIVESSADLARFVAGEVLVCDAIDPNMTFAVPLASAIVERRGGMLIHGAIVAREYGIPCVTGITHATRHIRTGDRLTVDGYLGIVTIDRRGAVGGDDEA